MTDTTEVRPEDDTKPCKECKSTEHTTSGHFDGGSPVTGNGHFDGGSAPISVSGHFDGGAPPKG